jgi:TorA maturation chaperone TorD
MIQIDPSLPDTRPDQSGCLKREFARCASYRFLHCVYSYPVSETINFLRDFILSFEYKHLIGHMGFDSQSVLGPLSDILHKDIQEEILEDLEVEYTRLFINSFNGIPAKPYESVYLDKGHLVVGDATIRVREFYQDFGVGMCPDYPEPPDHIAIETEFMAYLIDQAIDAYASGNFKKADRFRDAQIRFLHQHLLCWAWNFSDRICVHTRHPFYRAVGLFSKQFFDSERKQVDF